MKFQFSPVTSMEDVTRNFEQLEGLTVLDSPASAFQMFGNVSVLTFPGGSRFSNVVSAQHGLPRTPLLVVATASLGASGTPGTDVLSINPYWDDVNVYLWGGFQLFQPTSSNNYAVSWLAIG